jgi:hypothetical protein
VRHEIDIPPAYIHITSDIKDRKMRVKKFNEYVNGYIEKSFPEYRFIKIKGMKAICERR